MFNIIVWSQLGMAAAAEHPKIGSRFNGVLQFNFGLGGNIRTEWLGKRNWPLSWQPHFNRGLLFLRSRWSCVMLTMYWSEPPGQLLCCQEPSGHIVLECSRTSWIHPICAGSSCPGGGGAGDPGTAAWWDSGEPPEGHGCASGFEAGARAIPMALEQLVAGQATRQADGTIAGDERPAAESKKYPAAAGYSRASVCQSSNGLGGGSECPCSWLPVRVQLGMAGIRQKARRSASNQKSSNRRELLGQSNVMFLFVYPRVLFRKSF